MTSLRLLVAGLVALTVPSATAQVELTVTGLDAIRLGEPLVLDVRATRQEAGAWPQIYSGALSERDMVVVRRDSAGGPTVDFEVPLILCGISVPLVLDGREWATGTVSHRRIVVHDARLRRPGRYVVEVHLNDPEDIVGGPTRVVRHAVEVVRPADSADRAAAEAVARAVWVATDAPLGHSRSVVDEWEDALAAARGTVLEDVALAQTALWASGRTQDWARSTRPYADSVVARSRALAIESAHAYLDRRPAGVFAPRVAQALAVARDGGYDAIPSIQGLCEGTVFRYWSQQVADSFRAVAVDTRESVELPAGRGQVVDIEFTRPPGAVHLVRDGEIVGAALPNASTCGGMDVGNAPPRLRAH